MNAMPVPGGYAVPIAAFHGVNSTMKGLPMSASTSAHNWDCETFARIARAAFPASTAFYLSHITAIPVRTVEKHLRGETKPGADHCLAYLAAGSFGAMLAGQFLPGREPWMAADPSLTGHRRPCAKPSPIAAPVAMRPAGPDRTKTRR